MLLLGGVRNGLWTVLILLIVPAHAAGIYWSVPVILACTPSAWFWGWLSDRPLPADHLPILFAIYGGIATAAWMITTRMMGRLKHEIARKLEQMHRVSPGAEGDHARFVRSLFAAAPGSSSRDLL
jgi:hypothetical protein